MNPHAEVTEVKVLLPRIGSMANTVIRDRSGVVGVPAKAPGRTLAYYEGNVFGAAGMVTWADRCFHAASRLVAQYPTVATGLFLTTDFIEVGTMAVNGRIPDDDVVLSEDAQIRRLVARTLGVGIDDLEIECSRSRP
jgi:hypothetical protein